MTDFDTRPTPRAPAPGACPSCGEPLEPGTVCCVCVLRRAVEAAQDSPSLFQEPISTRPALPSAMLPTEADFGDYRLHERLGEGAMGIVHRATKRSLKKTVAIKFIKSGQAATPRDRTLFLREAELASRLDHPHIVNVSEVGEHEGTPFLVMRYVDGRPLSEMLLDAAFCPTLRERILLLVRVARAVHFAHQRGIIHRDLKPGNILVESDGTPFVTDFGLARWVAHSSTVTFSEGQAVGTPAYMPPEQARGKRSDLTTGADIWSLGVILYQIACGRLPFPGDSMVGIVHRILGEEPAPVFDPRQTPDPPHRSNGLPPADLRSLSEAAKRDLQSICSRCLEKEPARRYPTVAALAEDLERWLQGAPVEARPIRRGERWLRWIRRHPAAAGAIGASAIAVVAVAWSLWQRGVTTRTEEQARLFNYVADMNLAQRGLRESNSVLFARALNDTRPPTGKADLRGVEWGLLQALHSAATEPVWFATTEPLLHIATTPKIGRVAALGVRNVFLLDLDGRPLRQWSLSESNLTGVLAFDPSAENLLVALPTGVVRFSLASESTTIVASNAASHVAFSPDGRYLALACKAPSPESHPTIEFIDLHGRPVRQPVVAEVTTLRWLPSGTVRFANGRTQVRELARLDSEPSILSSESYYSPATCLSHSARQLLRTSSYGVVHLLELPSGRPIQTLRGIPGDTVRAAFSTDDRYVAFTTADNAVHVLETETGAGPSHHRLLAPGHSGVISSISFADEDRVVLSASFDGTIRRLALDAPRRTPFVGIEHHLIGMAGTPPTFRSDSKRVALVDRRSYGPQPTNGASILWDTETRRAVGGVPAEIVAWNPDDLALSWSRDGQLQMWDLSSPSNPSMAAAFRLNPEHHAQIESQMADRGRWILSVRKDGVAEAFQVSTSKIRRLDPARLANANRAELPEVDFLAASPDTAFAAIATTERRTFLWDIARDRVVPLLDQLPADIRFSPFGRFVAITDYEQSRLRLFDGRTGRALRGLSGHLGPVMCVDFTHDARQLITGSKDATLVVWNLATGREVFRHRLEAPIYWLRVSPDRRWLITGHLPTEFGSAYGTLGSGHYLAWPIPLADSAGTASEAAPAVPAGDTIWTRYRELARDFPP